MQLSIRLRRVAGIAVLAVFGLTGTAAADLDGSSLSRETCVDQQIEQPFAALGDVRDYVLAPGGSFEDPAMDGWALEGGATVVAGNDPFNLRDGEDAGVLGLPAGASATSPAMCVDLDYPTMRLVALQQDAGGGVLEVEVLYPEGLGKKPEWKKVGRLKADAADGWHASDDIELDPERGGKLAGARELAIRLTATSGAWQIDDLYVDPSKR